jgi:hypothetical protein
MTMNLEKKLAALYAEYAKEREALLFEHTVLTSLPEYARAYESRVHHYPLYGHEASVKWAYDFHRYDPEGKKPPQPTLELLARLADDLLPVPLVLVRDGCVSFRTAVHVEAMPEDKKARFDSVVPVAPFTARVSAFQQRTLTVEWVTTLAGRPVEVEFVLPLPESIGHMDVRFSNYMGGRRVCHCRFAPSAALRTLYRGDKPVADLAQPIKWASGSEDVPNDFTLYWDAIDNDVPTAVDLAAALLKAERA